MITRAHSLGIAVAVSMVAALSILWITAAASQPYDVRIQTQPVTLYSDQPDRKDVGSLTYAGGLMLRSRSDKIGGYSGLVVYPDNRFRALSDRGRWLTGRLVLKDKRLADITDTMVSPVFGPAGRSRADKSDTEGLTRDGEDMVLSMERTQQIWRYVKEDWQKAELVLRDQGHFMRLLPSNGGFEAITVLAPGRFLVLAEDAKDEAGHGRAWIIADNVYEPLGFILPPEHRPTAVACIPSDMCFLLLRKFSPLTGVSIMVGQFDARAVLPTAVIEPEIIAHLRPPMTIDNMEGLAVLPTDTGVRLYMISDDNFNFVQRTLLLAFDLAL